MDRLLRPVADDDSTVESSSDENSTIGPNSDHASTAGYTSKVDSTARPTSTDVSSDKDSCLTFTSDDDWSLPDIDQESTREFSKDDNPPAVHSNGANSISDIFSDDDAIGDQMDVLIGDKSAAGSKRQSYNPICINSKVKTNNSGSKVNSTLVSDNNDRACSNLSIGDAGFDASNNKDYIAHSLIKNQTADSEKNWHSKRSYNDVEPEVVRNAPSIDYDDDTDIEHFIGSLRT